MSLGEHLTVGPKAPRREAQKLWEMDGAARALVAANLDQEVKYLTTVQTTTAVTPDFAARLVDGRDIVVEHTRICGEADKKIAKSLSRVQALINLRLGTTSLPNGLVAFAFPNAPVFKRIVETVDEMVRAMRDTISSDGSTTRHSFDSNYPMLQDLDVHWTVIDGTAAPTARVEPWCLETDPQEVADTIIDRLAHKSGKHEAYQTHGKTVWLTIWVDVHYCLPTTLLHLVKDMSVRRGPF